MGKFFISIFTVIVLTNSCFAEALVLSDVIREAREVQMKKELPENNTAVKPVKNDCVSQSDNVGKYNQTNSQMHYEKSAEEKLNVEEIMKNK